VLLFEVPRVVAIRAAKREDDRTRFASQIDGLRNTITLRAAMNTQGIEGIVHGGRIMGELNPPRQANLN